VAKRSPISATAEFLFVMVCTSVVYWHLFTLL